MVLKYAGIDIAEMSVLAPTSTRSGTDQCGVYGGSCEESSHRDAIQDVALHLLCNGLVYLDMLKARC